MCRSHATPDWERVVSAECRALAAQVRSDAGHRRPWTAATRKPTRARRGGSEGAAEEEAALEQELLELIRELSETMVEE